MPRKKKHIIKTNSVTSLTGLLQEVYNDACGNINSAQRTINELTKAAEPVDVDELSKIAKETSNALKIKDSAIKIKLEVAKVQRDILKHNGSDEPVAHAGNSTSSTSLADDFKTIKDIIESNAKLNELK